MSVRFLACALVATLGCADAEIPGPDLERMTTQQRYQPFQASPYFEDGRVMRTPAHGTVPRERALGDPAMVDGMIEGQYASSIPVPITRDGLEQGRHDFETFCGVCHGLTGDGASQVAANMSLRKPPNLVADPIRAYPPGRIYRAIAAGYGLMRSYDVELEIPRRWGVVAYVAALQRSRATPLASLPPPVRARAEAALP